MVKVEIWSDVMCPFCYLGKSYFDKAVSELGIEDKLSIEWKSFQLNAEMGTIGISTLEYLEKNKGMRKEDVEASFESIKNAGSTVGLNFDFENAIAVNTAAAHRLIQAAKAKGLGNEIEEALFRAHFTEGKNVADLAELELIGLNAGLSKSEIDSAQSNSEFQMALEADLYEASQIGVRGVPFFVLDRKYAISGAQPVEVFKKTLEKVVKEWENNNFTVIEGQSCDVNNNCN